MLQNLDMFGKISNGRKSYNQMTHSCIKKELFDVTVKSFAKDVAMMGGLHGYQSEQGWALRSESFLGRAGECRHFESLDVALLSSHSNPEDLKQRRPISF